MMTKSLSFHQESYSPKAGSEDEDMIYIVDEMDSSHSNSPNHLGMTRSYHEDVMYYGMPNSGPSLRPKNKLEVLDCRHMRLICTFDNFISVCMAFSLFPSRRWTTSLSPLFTVFQTKSGHHRDGFWKSFSKE